MTTTGKATPGAIAGEAGSWLNRISPLRRLSSRYPRLQSDRATPPVALVYRGPASSEGCPEAVADLLRSTRWKFDVHYIGPDESRRLGPGSLTGATLYAQPGGGSLKPAYRHLREHRGTIRNFVRGGGRYLGFCLGGYLSGATPGFALLPGDADRYIRSARTTVHTAEDTVVQVLWRGRQRTLFFQDGPYFAVGPSSAVAVLATYPNGAIAAVVAEFGAGLVGVVGPHPEATDEWYADAGLTRDDLLGVDLGRDLVDAVMRR